MRKTGIKWPTGSKLVLLTLKINSTRELVRKNSRGCEKRTCHGFKVPTESVTMEIGTLVELELHAIILLSSTSK